MAISEETSVAGDPFWLVHRYDPAQDAFGFVRLSRAERTAAPFLTDEYLPKARPLRAVRRAAAVAAAGTPASLHYIFHSAYCCSTLLAAALDAPGIATSLKEPVVLNDLVGWRRRGGPDPAIAHALDAALTLLARPFATGEAIILKPSNVIAGIVAAMLDMRPSSHALLLYAPLREYVASIARKGLWGRRWVRELFAGLRQERLVRLGLDPVDDIMLTDLQIAAAGWLAQHELFSRLLTRLGAERLRSLRADVLLAQPEATLRALFSHFALPGDAERARQIANGPAFLKHSKDATAFGGRERARDQRDSADVHRDEIDKVMVWAEAVAAHVGLALDLAHPLLIEAAPVA